MSNLKVNQVTSDTWLNSNGTENYKVRAWADIAVVYGTPSVRAAGNVSSITDKGVGAYAVNFTKALPSSRYAILLNAADSDTHGDAFIAASNSDTEKTTSSSSFYTAGGSGKFDPPFISVAIVGG